MVWSHDKKEHSLHLTWGYCVHTQQTTSGFAEPQILELYLFTVPDKWKADLSLKNIQQAVLSINPSEHIQADCSQCCWLSVQIGGGGFLVWLPRKIGRSVVTWWVDFWRQYWKASETLLIMSLCLKSLSGLFLCRTLPVSLNCSGQCSVSSCLNASFTFQMILSSHFCLNVPLVYEYWKYAGNNI